MCLSLLLARAPPAAGGSCRTGRPKRYGRAASSSTRGSGRWQVREGAVRRPRWWRLPRRRCFPATRQAVRRPCAIGVVSGAVLVWSYPFPHPLARDSRLLERRAPPGEELAQAEDVCDAMPGGITLTLESAEVGGGDGERAVIEELAHGLDRLADVAAELGGGVAQDVNARGRQSRPSGGSPGSGCRRWRWRRPGDQRPPARATRRAAWKRGPCRCHQEIAGWRPREPDQGSSLTAANTALADDSGRRRRNRR